MVYIFCLIPAIERNNIYAFGRVFSGTVATGQKVRIMGNNYQPDRQNEIGIASIAQTVPLQGRAVILINDAPEALWG